MSLQVESVGSGRDLVLLHGWGTDARVFDELAPALGQRFRVHAVNLPGYGSSAPCTPYTPESIAEVLAIALPESCAVCGWSMGGQVALAWARRAPRQVTRIALVAATPCFVRRGDWPHAVEAEVLRQFAHSLATDREGTLRRFLALQAMGDDAARAVAARLRNRLLDRDGPSAPVLAAGLDLLLNSDLRGALADVAQPALVVHGDRDRLVPLAAGEYLVSNLPEARLETIRGAAHAPFVSRARATAQLLESFFDER